MANEDKGRIERKPIIHRVARENFPESVKNEKNLYGFQTGDHIYVVKGKSGEDDLQHEIYHFVKKHPDHPRKASDYIKQELDADIYALEKTGQRVHNKPHMIAVANDVNREYKMPMSKVLRIMSVEVKKPHIPKNWKKDFNHIAKRAYGGRKLPKGVGIQIMRDK
jgi:hypothetical protein